MDRDGSHNDQGGRANAPPPPGHYQIVVRMNPALGMQVANNCPSGDVVEMMLYRALMYVQRELQAGRLLRVEEPKVTIERSIPPGGPAV